jgi:hypothetical protein
VTNRFLEHDSADADNAWWVLWDPDMVEFRKDPRFAELVSELGLMDFWRDHGWPDFCRPDGDSLFCE